MSLKSTNTSYGVVAVSIHWLSAILILLLLVSGFRAGQTMDPAMKADILRLHAPMGILILVLTLARIIWWMLFDTRPIAAGSDSRWQALIAKKVHMLFYIIIIGMAASGIGMFVLTGAGPIIFGGAESVLPDFSLHPPRVPHGLGGRVMVALLLLHAGAALYHHFVKQDATLKRMWPGLRDTG